MIDRINGFFEKYLSIIHLPNIRITDIFEILIIAFCVYQIIVWVRNTKAWALLKGLFVILAFLLIAAIFNMTTILWIAKNLFSIFVIAVVVVLQPELRRALEQLGKKNVLSNIIMGEQNRSEGRFSDHTIDEVVKASFAMGKVRTGALMVFERNDVLTDIETSGIMINAEISSQLIINTFEHNTPLHDGAVMFRDNKLISATCYLPLSKNASLSKALGTRHRAAVGISEETDSLTIIVSEENGKVSVAYGGELFPGLTPEALREKMEMIQDKPVEDAPKRGFRWKSERKANEKKADK
ncbi:MAG: diadenylate cyclase CdaA [Lachnospiraceae bacterium]|nr:diadenylate cyclase CdaA [Lachnospiraceae bacterium]